MSFVPSLRAWIIGATLLVAACASRPETHLIPDGFVGPVVIVFGVPSGEEARREGWRTVYTIPSSGVLMLSTPQPGRGFYHIDYYYVRSDGTRARISDGSASDLVPQAFAQVSGMTTRGRPDEGFRWEAYVVGIPAQRSDWEALLDAATDVTLGNLLHERSASSRSE